MKNVKRKLALASIMLCGSVALGLASLNDATVSASAETLDGFEVKSASLRVPDDTYGAGIRFTIGLGNVNLAEDATTGVLLIPTSSLGSNALTLDFSHDDLRTYDNVQWKNLGDGTKEAYLHLYDVPPVQYTSNISICAYVDTPDADPIYSNVVTASVAEVADWAYYNDTTLDETAKASLQDTYLTYKVVYHNEDDTTETTGIYNQKLTAIESPEKVGYTFGGWWNQAGTHQWNFAETTVSSTITNLYAKWNPASDTAYSVKVFETTDGGKTQTEISVADFEANRTGTTGADLDITAEANGVVTKLGKGYTLNTEKSVLTGVISADGTTELKIVVNFDEVVASRVGEDANTLLFFDRELGAKQVIKATGDVYAYTAEKAYGNEDGSLKVTFPGTETHNTISFNLNNYAFNEDDYIVFYAYNDTTLNNAILAFGYSNGISLTKGSWTPVVRKASLITANGMNYFRLLGMNESTSGWSGATSLNGNVYFSKVTVCSADQVTDLTAVTGDWTIGDTTFTGAVSKYNNKMGVLDSYLDDALTYVPYKLGDVVNMKIFKHSYAGFYAKLKTSIDATSDYKYISITAKGADANLFTIVGFDTNGAAKTSATKAYMTREEADGFTTYIFRIKGFEAGSFRVTPLGDTSSISIPTDITISNFVSGDISSLRKGSDANTLFFYDTPLAVDLGNMYYKSGNNHQTVAYSTEKAYDNERGSTKVGGITYGSNAYCLYKTSGATLSSVDQEFLAGYDYLVFNVYSTAPRKLFFSVMASGTTYPTTGHKLMPNTWTRIVIPASVFAATSSYYFLINHIVSDSTLSGSLYDLYFSKIVRCPASEVTNLTGNTATDTWTVGSTTFTGAPSVSNSAPGGGVLAATEYKKPYLVNGELILTFTRASDPYITLNLANMIEVAANTETYITVVMYDYGRLDKLNGYLNSSGSYALSYVSHEDIGDGYAKVTLKCSAKSSAYTITSVRLDVEDHTDSTMATQFVIKDIAITTK
ncbi:MAG: InlB B-repeat-containing protein [Clostridia bacterium]|nr:InlB B-repeat-containing protein [Clostridia bacterium]